MKKSLNAFDAASVALDAAIAKVRSARKLVERCKYRATREAASARLEVQIDAMMRAFRTWKQVAA